MAKIIVVDDDPDLCDVISDGLQSQGHTVEMVHDGADAKHHLLTFDYDLIILDWDMPKASGVEVLRELRNNNKKTPVLMLTGKSDLDAKEEGLDSGADDYLTKPFAMRELHARLRSLLRRPQGFSGTTLSAGNVEYDPVLHKVTVDGKELKLLPKEMAVLEFFMRHKGQVFSAEAVLNRVWASDSEASTDSFRTCLKRLRQKIDKEGETSIIEFVHGLGYRIRS